MNQGTLLDAFDDAKYEQAGMTRTKPTEEAKRDRGMAVAASKNFSMLRVARIVADDFARRNGRVSIDDVRREMCLVSVLNRLGVEPVNFTPGNWMGSVFKEDKWEIVGMQHTTHKKGHARRVLTYKLRGAA